MKNLLEWLLIMLLAVILGLGLVKFIELLCEG